MPTLADQWAICAYHEAAHAIAYWHFNWHFIGVRICQTDDGEITGAVGSPGGTYDCISYATICLCGPIAEEKLTGVSYEEQHGAYADLLMAKNALGRLDPAPTIGNILPFTRLLVASNWPRIQRVATQLIVDRHLTYDQVVTLVQRGC